MEYKKLLLEPLHRTEAISMTLQEILSENNLNTALEHLNKKKGIPGIDKMSMDAFSEYWHKNKNIIKQKLENEHTNQDLLWHAILQNREKKRKEN